MRIFSSGVYFRRVAALTVRTKDLAASVRSSARLLYLFLSGTYQLLYLKYSTSSRELTLTLHLSGFSTPSGVPLIADDLQFSTSAWRR